MANENKEIGDIVKKCKILLLDIEGTTTSISFVKDKLFPYAEENVKQFLETEWENEDVKEAVNALRKLALEDKEKSVEGLVVIPGEDASKEDQIEGLVNNVKWQMSSDRKVGALKQLQGLIWKQGYDKGDIKGHVYDDVCSALEQWHSVEGQKIYIYSSGSVQAQKLLFGQSLVGDLLKYIDGHFDTAVGGKQEPASYTAIVEKVGCKADEILFLTDVVKEAEAARQAGLHVALVTREGNAPLTPEATEAFAVIHSLAQLSVSNKRKTEPQDEQPAKVPKTDVNNDVKTETETEKSKNETTISDKEKEEPEKMEVEEESQLVKDAAVENMVDAPAPVIEEVTKDAGTLKSEIKPVVTEGSEEKAEKKESLEAMETDSTENVESTTDTTQKPESDEKEKTEINVTTNASKSIVTEKKTENDLSDVPKENSEAIKEEEATPIPEKTSPTVITEIEEITDQENLTEVTEIDDIEPVVEEPNPTDDIDELQNVGDVLEKECDEILSKVQDVTNLDNIPMKPLLNPIIEESMETDNVDSNDIVERILEKEIELEMKNQENTNEKNIENTDDATKDNTNINSDKTEVKMETVEEKTENVEKKTDSTEKKEDTGSSETSSLPEEKVVENNVKIEIASEETEINSSPKEEKSVKENEEKLKQTTTENNIESLGEDKSSDVAVAETKVLDAVTAVDKPEESSTDEAQVNGKTNGEAEALNQNGNASNDDELSSRLSVENSKEVNGSNGNGIETENGQDEKKIEAEVTDIKVKTVTTEEPCTELIEQATEA